MLNFDLILKIVQLYGRLVGGKGLFYAVVYKERVELRVH